ncbi:MATE efflux family protein [Atractiella rhizophila]|nr:MATE efflux family protein [Atractiella rhizophila]
MAQPHHGGPMDLTSGFPQPTDLLDDEGNVPRNEAPECPPSLQARRRSSPTQSLKNGRGANENTPLLAPDTDSGMPGLFDEQWNSRKELWLLVRYATPIFATYCFEYSLLMVTVFSLGHLGTKELAAASLASITANISCISLVSGVCSAIDSLSSQAFTSSDPKSTSLHALRTYLILLLLAIPQITLFWLAEPIFIALRQDPEVAQFASVYLRIVSFGLPASAGFECTRRWLQAQALMTVPTLATILTLPINIAGNILLVWGPDSIRIGFAGAPVATVLSMWFMFLFTLAYSVWWVDRKGWGGFSMEILEARGLWMNFKMGIAGILMVGSEWWSWEIIALGASQMGPTQMAAQSVLTTTTAFMYQLPAALGSAAAVRTGNCIGAGSAALAKKTSRIAILLAAGVSVVNSLLLFLLRNKWGYLFTGDTHVIELVASVLPLVAAFQLGDAVSGASMGILRGMGRQNIGAVINFTAYYVVGLPLGFYLAFSSFHLGLFGLWTGCTVALYGTMIFGVFYIAKADWTKEVRRARDNLAARKSNSHTIADGTV